MNHYSKNQLIKGKTLDFLLYYLGNHRYFKRKEIISAFLTSYLKLGKKTSKYNDLRIFLSKIINNLYSSGILVKHSNTVYQLKHNSDEVIKEIVFSTSYISSSTIRNLYLKEKLNLTEISKIIGCNIATVSKRLKDMKIDTSRNYHYREIKLNITNKEIKKLYLEEKININKISKIALCNPITISRRLKKMGVELRILNKRKNNNN